MIHGIYLSEKDTVATITAAALPGDQVEYSYGSESGTVTANAAIPMYHKIAVKPVKKGENVYKYGEPIGVASADIAVGDWVHVHNVGEAGR